MALAQEYGKLDGVMWSALWAPYKSGTQSLQTQLRQMLVAAMLDGVLPARTYLPSTRDLATALGISRNTVIIVYQQLVDEGYLSVAPRLGYWVADVLPEQRQAPRIPSGSPAANEATAAPEHTVNWGLRMGPRAEFQRNIEKRSNWRDYPHPFLYGQFDAKLFPMADWRLCCLRTLNVLESYEWGQDMFLRDDPALVQQIRTRLLPRRGIHAAENEIIITVGSQQGLFLLADLFFQKGTRVGFENPGYPDARNIFLRHSVDLVPLQVDQEGLVLDERFARLQYAYVTPSHQCPTTVTMSMARREALLEQARRDNVVLIEDDYETEDGWTEEAVPALKSLDRDGRVIYVGSLSKSLAPGLRMGYVVAPPEVIKALHALRRLNIRHPNAFGQRALAMFLGLGHHNTLLRKLSVEHASRAAILTEAMRAYLPDWEVQATNGGSALWVKGPAWLDARQLSEVAERHGVLIEPGDVFFLPSAVQGKDHARHFRMGFTAISEAAIEPGVLALREAARELRGAFRQ